MDSIFASMRAEGDQQCPGAARLNATPVTAFVDALKKRI